MSEITIYEKPTCTTCKNLNRVLQESGVDYEKVNYYIQPFTKDKLKNILQKMGMQAHELIRKKGEVYKQLSMGFKSYTEEELIDLMVMNPDLIERPIVEKGERAILARPVEKVKEFLGNVK